jgi:hypothetical protein
MVFAGSPVEGPVEHKDRSMFRIIEHPAEKKKLNLVLIMNRSMWLFRLKDVYIILFFTAPVLLVHNVPVVDYLFVLEGILFFYSLLTVCNYIVREDRGDKKVFRTMLMSFISFFSIMLLLFIGGHFYSYPDFPNWVQGIFSLAPLIAWCVFVYAVARFIRNRKPDLKNYGIFFLMLLFFPIGIFYFKRAFSVISETQH